MTFLHFAAVLSGLLLQDLPVASNVVTVCEVLHHPAEFDGKMVRLRARERAGQEYDSFSDPGCSEPLELDGEKYIPSISKAAPEETRRLKRPATFEQNREEMDRVYRRLRGIPDEQRPWLIVTGRIDSFPFFRWQLKRPTGELVGKYRSFGYGHLNSYPAQIVVQSVEIDEEPKGK